MSEINKEIKIGDLVWAKMKGWSPWPGKVCNPTPALQKSKSKTNKNQYCIWFFGSENYGWIDEACIKDYEEFRETYSKTSKTASFKEACAAVEDYIARKAAGYDVDAELLSEQEDSERNSYNSQLASSASGRGPGGSGQDTGSESFLFDDSDPDGSIVNEEISPLVSSSPVQKKRKVVVDGSTTSRAKLPRLLGPSLKKGNTSARSGESSAAATTSRKKKSFPTYEERMSAGVTPVEGLTSFVEFKDIGHPRLSAEDMILDLNRFCTAAEAPGEGTTSIVFVGQPSTLPSKFKFGFLGLGIMGRGIVKNLLRLGHNVIVWNRSPDKIKDFIDAGAEQGMTPSEVVSRSDITFSCVADSQASKEMIFGIGGVLQGIDNGKSYVEMTGIDVETSKDIEEAVTCKGGRYLEAQLQGSKKEAEDGQLVLFCCGDKSLYDDCLGAFAAMGKTAFFLNNNAGSAAKLNLVVQLITGVTLSGLAEGMALAERLGLEMKDVMEALSLSSVSCPLVNEKGKSMCVGSFKPEMPLKHMQKDLNLALGLGNQHNQPLPVAAVANEVLKQARRLGYSEHDCAAACASYNNIG